MNQTESSLLGFLQSRSLFRPNQLPNSKTKSVKPRDSPRVQSPDSNSPSKERVGLEGESQGWAQSLQSSLMRKQQGSGNLNQSKRTQYRPQPEMWANSRGWARPQNPTSLHQNTRSLSYQTPLKTPDFSYKNSSATFETAHMQSFRCLDNVSNKISIRLTELNEKLDRFNHKLKAWVTHQLHFAYQGVITILDNAFKQQEILIRAYLQKVQQTHTTSIHKTKAILEAEFRRVDELKGHLKGPEWRKATGEILTSELQAKIDAFISQTYQQQQAEWIPRSYVRDHLRTIQLQIHEMLKLRTFAV